jgi:hypothetical protein
VERSGFRSTNGKIPEGQSALKDEIIEGEVFDDDMMGKEESRTPRSRVSEVNVRTQNPRISKGAVSQEELDSRLASIRNSNMENVRRVNSFNSKVLSQFTPENRGGDYSRTTSIRRSHSNLGSIGVSRVVIDNQSGENVGDFNIDDSYLHHRGYAGEKKNYIMRNLHLNNLYKLAALLGLSITGFVVLKDDVTREWLKNGTIEFLQNAAAMLGTCFNNIAEFLKNNSHHLTNQVLALIAIAGITFVIMLVLLKKYNNLKRDNFDLMADNCLHQLERDLREHAYIAGDGYVNANDLVEEYRHQFKLTKEEFASQVYPRMRAFVEHDNSNHKALMETSEFIDGNLKTIWKFK